MTFKPVLCWLSTFSALVLGLAWLMTIWCSMRWTYTSGRWFEFADGRICGGNQPRSAPEFSDFDILARKGPVNMRWDFAREDRLPGSWAMPIWAPLLLVGGVCAWSWRGGNAYTR